jgi:hypothetical protein
MEIVAELSDKAQPLALKALARMVFAHFGVGIAACCGRAVIVVRRVVRAVRNMVFMIVFVEINWLVGG